MFGTNCTFGRPTVCFENLFATTPDGQPWVHVVDLHTKKGRSMSRHGSAQLFFASLPSSPKKLALPHPEWGKLPDPAGVSSSQKASNHQKSGSKLQIVVRWFSVLVRCFSASVTLAPTCALAGHGVLLHWLFVCGVAAPRTNSQEP